MQSQLSTLVLTLALRWSSQCLWPEGTLIKGKTQVTGHTISGLTESSDFLTTLFRHIEHDNQP